MMILGIETSCDETAAAVVRGDRSILSSVVLSQWQAHAPYGGVVPEIAARAHSEGILPVIRQALAQANLTLADMDAIAATGGPGLIGGVIVGTMTGKALASALGKPFIAVNHLEGHALTARLTDNVAFPYLLLLASGGHCQFLLVRGVGDYVRLGTTLDDALGEAFDKVAKLLGLGMPGGSAVEKLAHGGNAQAHVLPVPLKGRKGCDFSFSGLKTAVRLAAERLGTPTQQQKADICASFQRAALESVTDRALHAIRMAREHCPGLSLLVAAGGVAANSALRGALQQVAAAENMRFCVPPGHLCTDNAAMIAWAGCERLALGKTDTLDFEPRARWPLSELSN